MNEYQDIIYLENYKLKYHPNMSIEKRAAQFAPFAALTGYSEAVSETSRRCINKKILSNDKKEEINTILQLIKEKLDELPKVKIIYFIKDLKKEGGKYIEYIGKVLKINEINSEIIFVDKSKISIEDIYDINLG